MSYHGDFVTCHLVHFIVRFVHFTKLVSSSANVDFSPLYGSLRISVEGLYSLSYSLQASDNSNYIPTSQHVNDEAVTGVTSLQSGLYLYPGTPGEISPPSPLLTSDLARCDLSHLWRLEVGAGRLLCQAWLWLLLHQSDQPQAWGRGQAGGGQRPAGPQRVQHVRDVPGGGAGGGGQAGDVQGHLSLQL